MEEEPGFAEGRLILFPLGQVVITPRAAERLGRAGVPSARYLSAHQRGDWGCVSGNDAADNDASVRAGGGAMSVYRLPDGQEVWVITDNGCTATTILLPDEY